MSNEILFMVGAAAMVAVSMLFLLPPLLGRSREVGIARRENNLAIFQQRREELKQDLQQEEINEAQFEQAEADLKRELLADLEGDEQSAESSGGAGRLGALITLVFVPLISISLYNYLGKPEAINSVSVQRGEQQTDQSREAFAQSVEKLEQKLLQNPNNLEGWMMLAKSYRYLGEEQKVVDTYEKALQQTGNESNASLLLEYGEALAEQNRGEWQGKPLEQLHRALEADPTHNDALWFAGNIYFDLGEYGQALGYWEKLSKLIPTDDAEIVSMVNQAANEAQKKLGKALIPLIDLKAATPTTRATLKVLVSLDPALSTEISPQDIVFVYAKAIGRKGPPLAAQRLIAADLPVTVTLDDSLAMMPGNNLSSVDRVIVGAKITKSGVATGGNGDLVSTIESATSNSELLQLQIAR